MNKKAMHKLSYGLYIVTTKDGEKANGCIVNTAIQAASTPNQLCICINKANYTLIRNLLGIVAQKNMYLNQKIKYTSRKTTREKLMAYLTDQAKLKRSNDFTIPFNRQELADYLGVERSAMSAELGKLTKLGILRTQRSHFTLLKPLD
jgi:hypothetical protein